MTQCLSLAKSGWRRIWRGLRERGLFDDWICQSARVGAGYGCLYACDEERKPSLSRSQSSAAVVLRRAGGTDAEDVEGASATRAYRSDVAARAQDQCRHSVERAAAECLHASVSRGVGIEW